MTAKMKRAVVTGGGGFVGKAVVKLLISQGVETAVVGRNNYPELTELGVTVLKGDIRDRDFLVRAFRGYDTVFHVAAKAGVWGGWDEYYSINVTGTRHVIDACQENSITTLVYTSTPSVVFAGEMHGADESLPYASKFLCNYAHTKAMAEKMVLDADCEGLMTTAIRPHLVWGPGDTNLIPRLLARGKKKLLKIVGDGRNRVDISYIDNVASAHVLAAENLKTDRTARGKAYFISQGEPVYLWEWINGLFETLDIPVVSKRVGFRKAYLAGLLLEMIYSSFRITKEPLMTRFLAEQLAKSHWFSIKSAETDFGYRPLVSTSDGVKRMVEWIQKTGSRG